MADCSGGHGPKGALGVGYARELQRQTSEGPEIQPALREEQGAPLPPPVRSAVLTPPRRSGEKRFASAKYTRMYAAANSGERSPSNELNRVIAGLANGGPLLLLL